MILRITRDMTRLALRVRNSRNQHQLVSWEEMRLLVYSGQHDCPVGPNGSPWYLGGYWPGKRIGVDVANPIPWDFHSMVLHPLERDNDGRVVFHLTEEFRSLPQGRYTGELHFFPHMEHPFDISKLMVLPKENDSVIPSEYHYADCEVPMPPPPPPVIRREPCILARFDIDLGPACYEHVVDQAVTDYVLNLCGEDCDGNT